MRKIFFMIILSFFPSAAIPQPLSILCEESAPYQVQNSDGSFSGMTVEIVREIQSRVKNTDSIQMVPWNRAYNLALKNKDTVLFSIVMTDERKDLFQWVGPISDTSLAFYAKKGSPIVITSHDEAKNIRSIGVYANDVGEQYLKKMGYQNLVRSYDNDVSLKNLMLGRVDLISIGKSASKKYAEHAGFTGDDILEVFVYMKSGMYIAFSKSTAPETVSAWKDALAEMKKDGSFAFIYHRYFPGAALP